MKIQSISQLYTSISENEKIIVDVLRHMIRDTLPAHCKEKIAYNVPFFYGTKGICIVWPASVPRGGIKSGVLLGFWYGHKLNDTDHYLLRGTNKQIFYRIYHTPEEIDEEQIIRLLNEAVRIDKQWAERNRKNYKRSRTSL